MDETAAAEYLAVAPKTLRNWRHRGEGPRYVRLGRAIRYRVGDLDAWVESQVVR